jgi:hypothetical protein
VSVLGRNIPPEKIDYNERTLETKKQQDTSHFLFGGREEE